MACFAALLKEYKGEVEDILVADKQVCFAHGSICYTADLGQLPLAVSMLCDGMVIHTECMHMVEHFCCHKRCTKRPAALTLLVDLYRMATTGPAEGLVQCVLANCRVKL